MEDLNTYIDHTLLKPTASKKQIETLCQEAKENKFKAVCVLPSYVKLAKECLKDSGVLVCTVIGFPLGANSTAVKAFEAKCAIEDGADEVDMVINIAAMRAHDFSYIENDISDVITQAHHKTVKVIIETCYLDEKEIIYACEICAKAGAHFVKTSTGFGPSGATLKDVKLIKNSTPHEMMIKASGGIKTREDAIRMIEAGADRIGTSSGLEIMKRESVKEVANQIKLDDY